MGGAGGSHVVGAAVSSPKSHATETPHTAAIHAIVRAGASL